MRPAIPERSQSGGQPLECRNAMRAWKERYGRLPSYDWSRTHARRRGAQALERPDDAEWPSASVVGDLFGTWEAARTAAAPRHEPARAIARGDPSPASPPRPGRRAAHGRASRIHEGLLDRVLRHADRLGARRIRAAPCWCPSPSPAASPLEDRRPRAFPSLTSGGPGLAGIAANRYPRGSPPRRRRWRDCPPTCGRSWSGFVRMTCRDPSFVVRAVRRDVRTGNRARWS